MKKNRFRMLRPLGVVILLLLAIPFGTRIHAQGDGFPLGAAAAYCEPGYMGPFVGCIPWEGLTISFELADGTEYASCVTAGTERVASCTVDVPFGVTIIATIDPASIPTGYVLEGSLVQEFVIPDGPPDGVFGGPVFVLLPAAQDAPVQPEGFPLSSAAAYCEPGYMGPFVGCTPWEGVTVSLQSADGTFATSCVTAGTDRAAVCTVNVPFGSMIIASIDPSAVPDGYALEKPATQEIQIPAGPPEGEFGGPVYVLLPATQDAPTVATVGDTGEGGVGAALFATTCDALDPDAQPAALLNDSLLAQGTSVGLEGAVPVATGYTVVPLPLDAVVDGGHSLVVFAEDDPEKVVACGAIGGVLDSNGALTIGLTPVEDSGMVGVAYLSEQEDGAATGISLFVMDQELPAD